MTGLITQIINWVPNMKLCPSGIPKGNSLCCK